MRKALVLLLACCPLAAHTQLPTASPTTVDYTKDVRPILAQNCYSCHGPEVQQAGLRLDLRQNALRGGDFGPVIIPGKSADSKLIRRVVGGDGRLQMPPTGSLSQEQIEILRSWIDQGAEFRTNIAEAEPAKSVNPRAAVVITAARSGDRRRLEKLIAGDPEGVNSTDAAGSTPLHHAAGFGNLETVKLLLDKGAKINATNRRSSTPLHWAIHDESKVRLLLERGAAVNAKQVEGRTPLFQSAVLANGNPVLRLLLEKGADPSIATLTGQTPLMAAATRGDVEALRLLIEKGADVNARNGAGETALMLAATNGNPVAVRFLLQKGADAKVRSKRDETALGNAATAGVEDTVKMLLDAGADVNVRNLRGYSPIMLAASSDAIPAGVVKLLLAKGADTSHVADYDETAGILAAKRGDTEVTRLLGGLEGETAESDRVSPERKPHETSVSNAVEKAMVLLEQQSYNFIRTAGCNSCHSQDLPSAAAAFAGRSGLSVPRKIPQLPSSMTASPEQIMDLNAVGVVSVGWELFDLGMNQAPRSPYTDAVVRYIKAMQKAEGNWSTTESRRPPMNSGDFQAAALAVYALTQYGPPAEKTSTDEVLLKAAQWLEKARPSNTQDRAFHLLGMAWSNASPALIKNYARALAAMQRPDGGWNQLPRMASDAYATGEVLYALHTAAKMSATDPVYDKGVGYLLRSQAADGSWQVKTRSIWLQPYFESGFPYGRDQFISTAATAWACMGLTPAIEHQKFTQRIANRK
jgi:ankyrin repeat protein/mono/diheme cytochrome c family protein